MLYVCPTLPGCCAVQADDPDAGELLDALGIEVIPSVQFWRNGKLLWEHRGVTQLDQGLGEGVLYFGDRWVAQLLARKSCVGILVSTFSSFMGVF